MDLVSSVPKGASALGHRGVQFRLTGDGSPQEMGHHRTHVFLAMGHCGVQFRQVESALLWTQLCFSLGALWGSVQADEILSHQNLLGVKIRDIFFQFLLSGDGSLQDPCVFGSGTLWGSVQADGIRSPQDLLQIQLWDK